MAADHGKVSWHNTVVRIVAGTATHPIEYAKFLIQIGHEPIAPHQSVTLFGRPALALPNVFKYLRHIKKVDGLSGCYRGLGLRLISQSVYVYANICTEEVLKIHDIFQNEKVVKAPSATIEDENSEDSEEEDDEEGLYDEAVPMNEKSIRFLRHISAKITCRTIGVIVSQPFHVAALRAMAQFVGRETRYNGVMSSIVGIYKESGISGFWSGLSPRLVGEIATVTIGTSLTFLFRSYIVHDKNIGAIVGGLMGFVASTLTYPFHVVTSCMSIRGTSLKAAHPANMPGVYTSWIGCWKYLQAEGQLSRGSSLLWRYYPGPQVIIGGRAIPLEPFKAY
ncbi:hypothetical protein B566_EDAN009637 [Ephemera danica]|nr:hypothetical protein B566_EDAN009637 [Ephemera danica]